MPWASSDFVSSSGVVRMRELICANVASISDRGGIDAEFLGFLDLHLLVDQFVDHLLPGGGLVREDVELAALLDIVVGDGLAIDHHGDGLRVQLRSAAHAATGPRRRS